MLVGLVCYVCMIGGLDGKDSERQIAAHSCCTLFC